MDLHTAQPSNVFNYATEQGRNIVHLHLLNLVVAAIVASIVIGLITFVAIKFRHRKDDAEPPQSPGNLKLEIIWTAVPALVLLIFGILTARVMLVVNPPVGPRQPDVIVNAHQWWWEYRYPKTGVVTANEFYLPAGVDSLLEIRAADVVHSFWIPDFGEKMDAIPGHPNHLFFKPIRQGVFTGSCAEFCGADHSLMRIVATVVSPRDFQASTRSQLNIPAPPLTETGGTAKSSSCPRPARNVTPYPVPSPEAASDPT